MKKILFLVENTDNLTAINLIRAFGKQPVDVIPYFRDKHNQCTIVDTTTGAALLFGEKYYYPRDYDAALLWCWGTAEIGRQYLRLFEDQGVAVLNSSYQTAITDSKIGIARLFQKADISTPKTLCFDGTVDNTIGTHQFNNITEALGQPPYILKADYGTQGHGTKFLFSVQEAQQAITQHNSSLINSGFIIQEFIGDAEQPIFHYRILVIGNQVISTAIKATAPQPMSVSNVTAGGIVEWITVDKELKNLALEAVQASGLNVAGVDIMVSTHRQQRKVVVIEVNDGPGTKTFDKQGINVSQAIIDYFINRLNTSH